MRSLLFYRKSLVLAHASITTVLLLMAHPLAAEYHLTAYFAAYLSEYIRQMSIIVM